MLSIKGDGPRICIVSTNHFIKEFFNNNFFSLTQGARLGKLQAKLGLITAIKNYKFELADKKLLTNDLEFDATKLVLTPKKEIMYVAVSR